MTNAVCESLNKSWVVTNQCRLKAVQRNKTTLNIGLTILHPANDIYMRLQLLKRANGYKPFLVDYTINACEFIRRRNQPVIKVFFDLIKDFTTMNHSCPYVGPQGIKDLYVNPAKIPVPLPTGEYVVVQTWMFDAKPQLYSKVYFTFIEDF
ncbi:uncharacterized protein LOC115634371 [Scaptodrosophila lebanonensis]|uniref:Uncharacterized protein LOC115634371 n=1 Tax=Drosophila lebanonensis TaxID=7225 RepID=A0A6J2UK98_DROLE|nr:uncharacterized protein LOC115634371 [Scaptodrosophila lebanonensis]